MVDLVAPKADENSNKEKYDKIEYKIDEYDKVRMRLFREKEELWKKYEITKNYLEENSHIHPKKRTMPCCRKGCLIILFTVLFLATIYLFLFLVQLALFNLVIVSIFVVGLHKIF